MKKVNILIFVIVLGLGILFYTGFWGFSYPRCSEREKILEIPDYLKNVTIRFERPFGYIWYSTNNTHHPIDSACTETGRMSKGYIEPSKNLEMVYDEDTKKELISPDENFRIIKRVYIKCPFLICIDRNDPGEEYLLQNSKGDIWRVGYEYFQNDDSARKEKPWTAGYYDSAGQRLGDVTIETK